MGGSGKLLIVVLMIVVVVLAIIGFTWVSYNNGEIRLRNSIAAQ